MNNKIYIFSGFFSSGFGLFSEMAITTDRILDILVPTQCSMDEAADAGTTSDDTTVGTEVDSKVKTKLLSMWNNVKYGVYILSQEIYIYINQII